jgi:hypothetical protein
MSALCAVSAAVTAASYTVADARGGPTNAAPRLVIEQAATGRFYDEGTGRKRARMVHLRFTLCDDGPQNLSPSRYARIIVTHRWGTRRRESLLVRESSDLITYDVYFRTAECVRRIPWTSAAQADLPQTASYRCYAVSVQVRDPAGKASNLARRILRGCAPRRG